MEEKKKKSVPTWPIVIMIMVALVLVATVLIIQMQGTTTTSGSFPEPESTESITCTNDSEVMSIFDASGATSKKTRVVAIFEKGKLDHISVTYSLSYDSVGAIKDSSNINQNKINLATQNEGLGADIFNLHFSKLSSSLEITMYAEAKDISNVSAKYLMLDQASGSYSETNIKKIYTSQGFKCS